MSKRKVHIVLESLNSQYPEDVDHEIVRVFATKRAATKWAADKEAKPANNEYRYPESLYEAETHEVQEAR